MPLGMGLTAKEPQGRIRPRIKPERPRPGRGIPSRPPQTVVCTFSQSRAVVCTFGNRAPLRALLATESWVIPKNVGRKRTEQTTIGRKRSQRKQHAAGGTCPQRRQSGAWHPRPRRGQNVPLAPPSPERTTAPTRANARKEPRSRTRRAKPAPKRANAQEEPRLRPPALPPLGIEREARDAQRRSRVNAGRPRRDSPRTALSARRAHRSAGNPPGPPVGSNGSKDYASFSTARMMAL